MKASDILPLLGRVKLPGGTEGRLLRDRMDKRLGLAVTVGGLLIQLATQAATRENYLQNLPKYIGGFFNFVRLVFARNWAEAATYRIVPGLTGIAILIGGLLIYLVFVLRGLIKQYSEEPFRYTFWINQFKKAEGDSEKAATSSDDDPLHHLLHHDLMERLSMRINRLSLIDDTNVAADDKPLLSSHIHIDGHYTVRRLKGNKRVIHVMPRIRIGPPGMPWNLTRPIQVALREQSPKAAEPALALTPEKLSKASEPQPAVTTPAAPSATAYQPQSIAAPLSKPPVGPDKTDAYRLNPDDYSYVVERVYSNIATEIYNQIKTDLNTKIELFPSKYLRAIALYHEAEDFARSNTVDAYDHAIELYRQARSHFRRSLRARLVKLLLVIPEVPIGTSIQIMSAKTEIGYAKCVIYRRKISALSGRHKNPLFEVSGIMTGVVRRLVDVHNRHRSHQLRLEIPWPFGEEREVLLQVDDIRDPEGLFAILRDATGDPDEVKAIRQTVRSGLSSEARRIVAHTDRERFLVELPAIVRALNLILKTEQLHSKAQGAKAPTPKEDQTLVQLNRVLLDEAFASTITAYQTRQKDAQSQVRERSTEEREVLLQVDDIRDPEGLFAILRDATGDPDEVKAIRQTVRSGLSSEARRIVAHTDRERFLVELPAIVRALNLILKTERLHSKAQGAKAPTPKEDQTLVLLNRVLLDEAFASTITAYRTRQKDAQSQVRERSTMVFLASKGRVWQPGVKLLRKKEVTEDLQHIMFEAYLVAALAYADLGAWQRAENCIALAKAIAPAISEYHPLFLLAAGSIEPVEVKATPLLARAAEIDPDFQIAKYLLADRIANQFRMAAELTRQRVTPIVDKYEDVLRLNPGNVAALAAQGYLWWLVRNLEAASSKFVEGCEIKAVVSETFIGELNYGMARVAAETGDFDTSYDLYLQAIAAEPGVAAALVTASRFATTSYYSHIGPAVLARYEDFLGRVESFIVRFSPGDLIDPAALIAELNAPTTPVAKYIAAHRRADAGPTAANVSGLVDELNRLLDDKEFYDKTRFRDYLFTENLYELISKGSNTARLSLRNRLLLEAAFPGYIRSCFDNEGAVNRERTIKQSASLKAVNAVYSYVLNDYGNACLNYYLGFGETDVLAAAIVALEHSTRILNTNAVAFFNLSTAYSHQNNATDKVIKYLEATERLSPAWPFVRTTSALQKVRDTRDAIRGAEEWVRYYQEQLDSAEAKKKELEALAASAAAEESAAQQAQQSSLTTAPEQPKRMDDLLKEEAQRATPTERLLKTREEINAVVDQVEVLKGGLQEYQQQVDDNQKAFEKGFNEGLASIFQDTKLQPLFQQTGRAVVVNTIDKLLNDRTIDWDRLDEGDVHALQGCAEILSYSGNLELQALECARKLAMHLLERYYPENFDTNFVLYNIYSKLGSGAPRHAETTLAPVTDYWLAQQANHFNTVYYRHFLNLEKWAGQPLSETDGPKPAGYYRLLGNVFAKLRKYENALAAYHLAVEESPNDVASRLSRAAVYRELWRSEEELEELIEAQLLDPENLNMRRGLAQLFAYKGGNALYGQKWQEAAEQFQMAVAAAPYDPSFYFSLATAWETLAAGEEQTVYLDKAIETLEKAEKLAPPTKENQDRLQRLRSIKVWRSGTWDDRFSPPDIDVSPICIKLSAKLVLALGLTKGPVTAPLKKSLNTLREDFWTIFGLKIPEVRFWQDEDLPEGHYSVEFFEARVRWWEQMVSFQTRELFSDRKLFVGSSQELDELGVQRIDTIDPLTGNPAFWIESPYWKTLQRNGKRTLGMEECLMRHLWGLLGMHLSEFLGHQDVVELGKIRMPDSLASLTADSEELRAFTLVLRAFLAERVPIESLALIHKRFVNMWRAGMAPHLIVERIRQAQEMRPLLSGSWSNYRYYRLTTAGESFLENALDRSGSQPVLALEPDPCLTALSQVREFVGARGGQNFALVVRNTEVRAHLRRLVQLEFPHLWILSEEEMTAEMKGRIRSDFELELTDPGVAVAGS